MIDLLNNKTRRTYDEIVPLISKVTGKSIEWIHDQSSIKNGKLPKEDWKSTSELRDIWLASTKDSAAEEFIYRDDRYILESLISYLFWSRDYVKRIERIIDPLQAATNNGGIFKNIKRVIDFGGGIGLSSLHLQQMFDRRGFDIQVVYHNVPSAVKQNEIAAEILRDSKVEFYVDNRLPDGDCFFMSEVLEHIQAPVSFVSSLLDTNDIKLAFHASSFTLPNQPGHFDRYDASTSATGVFVPGDKITKYVNGEFFKRNYKNVKSTILWNNRPMTFIKSSYLNDSNNSKAVRI